MQHASSSWGTVVALGLLPLAACGDGPPEDPPPPPAPSGSAIVRFRLETEAGAEVSCAEQNLTGFRIALGGMPVTGACGASQEAEFDDLLPGRYPVLIELLAAGDAVVRDHVGNVVVEDGQVAEYVHVFPVSGGPFGTGTLALRWFIDGREAAQGCPLNGGDEVRIRVLEGPGDDRMLVRPCREAQYSVEGVRQGTYRVELELVDASGDRIGFPAVAPRVQLDPGTTETVFLDVVTRLLSGGELLALWTVSGTVAAEGCRAAPPESEVELTIRRDDFEGELVTTATAACATGGLAFDDLPLGRSVNGAGLRVTYQLIDRAFGTQILDTEAVGDIVLQPSRTATVAVDLVP